MKKTYNGSCHCGKVQFEVDMNLDHVRVCDCSVCRRRGALNHWVEDKEIHIFTPLDELIQYKWHTMTATDLHLPCMWRFTISPSKGTILNYGQ